MRKSSKKQRREAFMSAAAELFEEMEAWYDEHPDATFGEIEDKLRRERRELMGETTEILINGRSTGQQMESPECPSCGREMRFEGYRSKTVNGLEGTSELERTYYRCPYGCKESLFPPGSSASSASGSVE